MSVHRADGSGLMDEALQPSMRGASCIGRERARRLDGLSSFGDQSHGQDRATRVRQKPRVVRSTPSAGRRRGSNETQRRTPWKRTKTSGSSGSRSGTVGIPRRRGLPAPRVLPLSHQLNRFFGVPKNHRFPARGQASGRPVRDRRSPARPAEHRLRGVSSRLGWHSSLGLLLNRSRSASAKAG